MTYRHPHTPDPWADPDPADDDASPPGFAAAALVIALPVFALAFSLGYMSGVWGWI